MKNGLFSIGTKDVVKAAIMAAGMAIATGLTEVLTGISATPPIYPNLQTLTHLAIVGITTGVIYIIKNLLTNSNDQFLVKEPISTVQPPEVK